ncbi:hypothetical protein EJJ20_12180 [Pseudomonas poae]|nr:hypothetical protein EJJ20_12180 [Pseudomonas poae]
MVDETDNALAIYETPADQSKNFRALLAPDFNTRITQDWNAVAAHASQSNAHQSLQPVRTHYARQVDRLTQDANAFFQTPPALPVRGELPELAAQTTHAELLKKLLVQHKGLVVGAVNTSIASKQLLIENIKTLAELGVRRLYIENLPADLFRKKLAIINRQAKGNIASALKSIEDHLARVDLALGYTREAPYTFRTLMLQAHQHNIAVEGLDATCSYHMNHLLDLRDGERFMPRSSRLRNFYSHKVIERNTAKNADEGWIALVEQNRLGTYETVPGLPDLQNTLALRVVDAAPGQSLGVAADTSAPGLSRGHYTTTLLTSHHARVKPGTPQPPCPPSALRITANSICRPLCRPKLGYWPAPIAAWTLAIAWGTSTIQATRPSRRSPRCARTCWIVPGPHSGITRHPFAHPWLASQPQPAKKSSLSRCINTSWA